MNNTNWNIAEKKILITGASRGIGFQTALGLARQGAQMIIASHNEEHCENAVNQIERVAGEGSARYYVADLSSFEDIKTLAAKVQNDYQRLDILINNVGGWFYRYQESQDGIEMTFALNHLSYFLLTGLLLAQIRQSTPARIINVSSGAHRAIDSIHFNDIQFKNGYRPFQTYAQSKLANIMFTYQLAERLSGSGISVNALHPGGVASHLYRDFGIFSPIIRLFLNIFGKSAEQGAETSIYLASSADVKAITGKYFADKKQQRSSDTSYHKDSWHRLWEISEKMTGFNFHA